ncbi:putative insertion element HTH domain-containing protein [Dysgonomonas alginatilytica]|uniref:Putative insertion element HTH domain-containing protein n=1 Tax=Dysgonomonas alginatilytica TaxID=1605892 RepID=A0A2V3PL98_9BACT|nr:phBC6A51 family helix-turn-helix protein [Dysgonomonas alginatilytica]PXV61959.1 putative insertion element HTH domain-containing protein [Dysgonomonas alginatilytica]
MGKFNRSLSDKITALIEEDNYTITEICCIVGISRKIFYEWKATKPDFAEALDQAVEAREEKLKQKARQSMRQKLEGYRQIETKTTYVASKDSDDPYSLEVKEYVVKEKYCVPETSAIVYSLSGGYSESKGRKEPQAPSPLVITVDSEKTKRDLERLQKNLSEKKGSC